MQIECTVSFSDKDGDKVWKQLTESEQRQFQKAMSSGILGNLLSIYTPWWSVRVGWGVTICIRRCTSMYMYASE